jgi:hypothetical protein
MGVSEGLESAAFGAEYAGDTSSLLSCWRLPDDAGPSMTNVESPEKSRCR